MAKYSIEDTTLIAIGDAVRSKTGIETKTELADIVLIDKDVARNEEIKYSLPEGTDRIEIKALAGTTGTTAICTAKGIVWFHVTFDASGIWSYNYMQDGFYFQHISEEDGVNRRAFEITCYDARGNIIPGEQSVKNTMTPMQMAEAINSLEVGGGGEELPEEAFNITGSCKYKFSGGGWDWFIDMFGDKITTSEINDMNYMFSSSQVANIPFEINGALSKTYSMASMFNGCNQLTELPKIVGRPSEAGSMLAGCNRLREISEESVAGIDWSYIDTMTASYAGTRNYIFYNCFSLRKFPMSFLTHGNPKIGVYNTIYGSLFNNCYALDEIVGLPLVHREASFKSSNIFTYTFDHCERVKRLTFETNEDGSPVKIDTWGKQIIDLSKFVGYTISLSYITDYNSGITADKEVTDDTSYQALKNDPDWFTEDWEYSRYNHDSAVETINSLPDLSAVGGNTIKFKGASGAKTDGGAISNLTEEEIAVATAKGWTVQIV